MMLVSNYQQQSFDYGALPSQQVTVLSQQFNN
jgi:hypothetical protein